MFIFAKAKCYIFCEKSQWCKKNKVTQNLNPWIRLLIKTWFI